MERICKQCGNRLGEDANFCDECGSKYEEFCTTDNKENLEHFAQIVSEGTSKVGTVIASGLEKGKEKLNEFQNMSREERKEKANEYAALAKEQGKAFVEDVKNFKTLSKKKQKKTISILVCTIMLICLLLSMFLGGIGLRSLSPEQKIELAKSVPLNYFRAEDLLSSGGMTSVSWSADEDIVKASRSIDGIVFEFVVTSDGHAYLQRVTKNGEEISEPAIEAVLEAYYNIGAAAGTLQ